ncbi:MAG: hypothetical protein ACRCXT_04485 [Paraclostridium sp.]
MGYYTDYKLKLENASDEQFDEIKEYFYGEYLGYIFDGGVNVKWYDHDTDMIKLSSKYKSVKFILTGIGEDGADVWIKKYKDGVKINEQKLDKKAFANGEFVINSLIGG